MPFYSFDIKADIGIGYESSWLVPFSEEYKGYNGIYVKK